MIVHKHECIFIHIPKTGGQSIERALGGRRRMRRLHKGKRAKKHGRPSEWRYPKFWERYYSFTFVRNPWDRAVSSYFYDLNMFRRKKNKHGRRRLISKLGNHGFKEFACSHLWKFARANSRGYHHKPQSTWLEADYNFIGRFENFQEDFNVICDEIGVARQQLPHENKSNHKHYTEYYDEEAKQIIAEIHAEDIKRFGYEFGG